MPRYLIAAAMLCLALAAAAAYSPDDSAPPVAHWSGDGNAVDSVQEIKGELFGGARFAPAVVGEGFLFDGVDDGLNLPDDERLRFTRSLTIKTWIKCLAYPTEEHVAGQIVFRGDERPGLDPYHLSLHHDGTLYFTVENGTDIAHVEAPFPLGRFVYVTASLDDRTGVMRLMYGRKVAAQTVTAVRPLRDLDPNSRPGIGIGNHCRQPESIHHQPFRGIVDELTLSGRTTLALESLVVSSTDIGKIRIEARLGAPAPPDGAAVQLTSSTPLLKAPAELKIAAGGYQGSVEAPANPSLSAWTITAEYNGSKVIAARSAGR